MTALRPAPTAAETPRTLADPPRPASVKTLPRHTRRGDPLTDRGSVSAQVLVIWPVLFTVLLLIIQAVVWAYASYAAQAAAARGLDTTRTLGGTSTAGAAETRQILDQLDAGPLTDEKISVDIDAGSATVRVDGHSQQIVPWLHLPVHAQATGPLETGGP